VKPNRKLPAYNMIHHSTKLLTVDIKKCAMMYIVGGHMILCLKVVGLNLSSIISVENVQPILYTPGLELKI